jgi:hypothetical protein
MICDSNNAWRGSTGVARDMVNVMYQVADLEILREPILLIRFYCPARP